MKEGIFFTLRSVLIFLALVILFELFFSVLLIPAFENRTGGEALLDMSFGFGAEQAYEMVGNYGVEGRRYYHTIQLVDLLFPVSYTLLLLSLIGYLAKRRNRDRLLLCPVSRWLFLPLLAGICDLLENAGIFAMLRIYPDPFPVVARMTSIFGVFKFSAIAVSIGIVLVLLIFRPCK